MTLNPITSWQRMGKNGNSDRLYFGGLKITADGDCSHEIKRCLLLGRKVMTNHSSILKSRDITLPTKVCLVKVMVFPVVMYGCESQTINKAEHWRIDAFELWCWRRLFFFFNFILFLNFTILYWFCQISKWIRHRYTCVPHPEPSSLLPPHTIPLGCPSRKRIYEGREFYKKRK